MLDKTRKLIKDLPTGYIEIDSGTYIDVLYVYDDSNSSTASLIATLYVYDTTDVVELVEHRDKLLTQEKARAALLEFMSELVNEGEDCHGS